GGDWGGPGKDRGELTARLRRTGDPSTTSSASFTQCRAALEKRRRGERVEGPSPRNTPDPASGFSRTGMPSFLCCTRCPQRLRSSLLCDSILGGCYRFGPL